MAGNLALLGNLLVRNKRLKGLSLLLAILTWYIIQDTISFELQIPDVKLQIEVKEGLAILNQSASTVDVTLRGSQEDIQLMDPRRLQAVVELSGESGRLNQEVAITPAMIRGIRGVRAVAVHPSRILVTLDHQAEKRVPVKGRTTGTPLFGEVESVACEPSTVLLSGPAAKLKTTDCVYTQPVDVDGRVETFVRRASIQAPGDNWVASIEPADVQVKVQISGRESGTSLKNIPVNAVLEPGRGMMVAELAPPAVEVVLRSRVTGGEAEAGAPQVRAFADCTGLTVPGTYTVPVRVLPVGGGEALARPDMVKVTLRLMEK